jgi:Domain of unknown function (DUF4280)
MPGPLIQTGATIMCPHGGQVTNVPTNTRVLANGMPLATSADTFMVAGCAFTIPPSQPSPCLTVQWIQPAARVTLSGTPALLQTSNGLCQNPEQAPQGPPIVALTQLRVSGT